MRRITKLLASAAIGLCAASLSNAAVISLDFEGIAPYPNNNDVLIQDYYNGGTSSISTSGTNYGASFTSNALLICLNTVGTVCSNTSHGGLGDPASAQSGLFFLSGANTFLNLAAGFDTGFSFNYTAINNAGSVEVYSGLNGTGTLLATLALPTTASACDSSYGAAFCPFVPIGVAFSGTAQSISFAGSANQIVFDDITFGSVIPGPEPTAAPEPATLGTALLGLGYARRRRG